jgi:hypothetical protein
MSGDHNQYQKDNSYLDFECPRCGHCCYVDDDDTSQNHVDETAKCKHEWVGLTADEVYECWLSGDVVAAVEAKLKEKNNG